MKKRKLLAMGLAMCMLFTMTSPVQAEEEKVKLRVMSSYDPKTLGQHYVDAWEQAAEELGYEVEVESMGSEAYKTKVKVALAGDELPDVFTTWGGTYVEPFIEAGAVLPVQDYIEESGIEYKDETIFPYEDGNTYVIVNRLATYNTFYYNKKLVEEVGVELPETFDDLLECVEKVKAYNEENGTFISTICLGDKDRWVGEVLYTLLVAREDKEAFNKAWAGETDFTGEAFLNAAKKIEQLVEAGAFTEGFLQISAPEANELFAAEDALFYAHQSSLLTKLEESLGDDLGVMAFPDCSGDPDYAKTLLNAYGDSPAGLMVASRTEYPEEACKLAIRFAEIVDEVNVRDYGQASFLANIDYQPEGEVAQATQQFNQLVEEADTFIPYVEAMVSPAVLEEVRDLSQKLFGSAISAEEYVEENNKILTQES